MNKDQEISELSPSHFVEAALGFQKTAALKAALALDLFTAIASEEGDIDKTAKRVKASVRGIRILCDYLTVHGFLTKTGVTYELTSLDGQRCRIFSCSGNDVTLARRPSGDRSERWVEWCRKSRT
jgi:hypothetical protein